MSFAVTHGGERARIGEAARSRRVHAADVGDRRAHRGEAPATRVHDGDVLIALEAMKMELPIRAPRDGVVRAVHCREGELVQPDQVLLELE